jgi:isopentenyldiphosphate isomerase
MAEEILQVVDINDKPIGGAPRSELKAKGLRYRIVRILVEDKAGNTIVQKRVSTKDTYPNCWDNSAAGHVDEGEEYLKAAKRELAEEIGLTNVELEEVDYYYAETVAPSGHILNRFTKIYRVVVDHDTVFTPQLEEVSEITWMTRHEVAELVKVGTGITDGLEQVYKRYYSKFDENN